MIAVFFVSGIIFLVLGLPVALTIGFSSAIYILLAGITPEIIIQRLFSGINNTALMAIPFFILAGELMNRGGIARRLVNLANAVVGNIHGSLAIVAVLACMFFSSMSGSGVATAASIGAILIPEMVKKNYDRVYACTVVAGASPIGVILPPSISFIIYGVLTGTSITDMYRAGIPSGIIIGAFLILYAYLTARRKNIKGDYVKTTAKEKWLMCKDSVWALGAPLILLGGVFGGIFTPTESAVVAVIYSLVIGMFVYKDLKPKEMLDVFLRSGRMAAKIMLIISCATLFAYVMTYERIPHAIVAKVVGFTDSKFLTLLMINLILLGLGTFMETGALIIIMTPLLMPLINIIGVHPVHFGMILTVNTAIGLVTPPVGVCLFTVSQVGSVSVERLTREIFLPVLFMLAGLAIITYFPETIMFMVKH